MSSVKVAGYPAVLLLCVFSAVAQSASPPVPARSTAGHLILEPPALTEDETRHRTNTPYPSDIRVTVKDAEDRPIPGATVEFAFPEKGPGALLRNATATCTEDGRMIAPVPTDSPSPTEKVACVKTGDDGIARIDGLRANKLAGAFAIRVKASFGGETTDYAHINVRNELPPFLVRNKRKLWIIGAASAAAAIAVVLLRPTSPPSATIGSVTGTGPVGAP